MKQTLARASASLFLFPVTTLAQGSALDFDGVDDYVELGAGDSVLTPLDRSFTVEAWLRVPQNDDGLRFAVATAHQPFCSDEGFALAVSSAAELDWLVSCTAARAGCGNDTAVTAGVPDFDVWHHFAATYDVTGVSGSAAVGTLRLYVDGAPADEVAGVLFDTETRPVLKLGTPSFAGHAPGPATTCFRGALDEVRIWSHARSGDEILCTMNTGLAGTEDGLVGYWPLDEGAGQTVGNAGNPAAWITDPFGWSGVLGGTAAVEASDPTWIPSTAPVSGIFAVAAREVVRAGSPPNPLAFLPGQTSAPVLGATWDPVVDHGGGFAPSSFVDFVLIAQPIPIDVSVPPLVGRLLCNIPAPNFIHLAPPGIPFAVAVPDDCSLAGLARCTQGGSVTPGPLVHLANGLDVTVGTF